MTIEEAKKLDHFMCSECASDDDVKRSQNGFSASSLAEVKARLFSILFPFFLEIHFCGLNIPHLLCMTCCELVFCDDFWVEI
jgi:hypothetical protein